MLFKCRLVVEDFFEVIGESVFFDGIVLWTDFYFNVQCDNLIQYI